MSAAAPQRPERILAFRRGERVLGLEGRYCREVTALAALTPVPLAPACLLGVGNLRGALLPVIDLAPLLELAAPPWEPSQPVHVTAAAGVIAGIAIDEVAGFDPWPGGEPQPLEAEEPAPLRAAARGWLPFRGGRVVLLDLPGVLGLARERLAAAAAAPAPPQPLSADGGDRPW